MKNENPAWAWTTIVAFAVLGAITQMLWLTYPPFTAIAATHYRVSPTAIGWLANVFPLWYVVLAIPAGLALDRWPRATVALGAALTAVGAVVRLAGDDYVVALIGQNLVAIAQPLILTAITAMASRYLAESDRPKGIALASAGTFAGMIAAFLLGTLSELRSALIAGAILAFLSAVVMIIALLVRPRFSPSRPSGGVSDFTVSWRNPLVRRLCLMVVVPFGTFTSLSTWAQPLLQPAGVDSEQARTLLIVNITAGVIGCAVIPVWAARRRRRRLALALGILTAVVGCVLLALAPSFSLGMVCFAVVGALLLPALPVVLEVSERAVPAAPGAAAGLVWMAGQFGALVMTGVIGALIDVPVVAFLVLAALTSLALLILPDRRAFEERTGPWTHDARSS